MEKSMVKDELRITEVESGAAKSMPALSDSEKDHAAKKRSFDEVDGFDVAGAKRNTDVYNRRSSNSEVEAKEKELDLLKKQIESEEKKLIQVKREMEEETSRKKTDLELILAKIEESGKQLVAVDEQLESQQRMLEEKQKRVEELNSLTKISDEQLYSKEMKEVEKLVYDVHKRLPAAAPINDNSQQNEADQPSFSRRTVFPLLRSHPNPAEWVLGLLEVEQFNEELSFDELEVFAILFQELINNQRWDEFYKIQQPDLSQLQHKASEVATLWKGIIVKKNPVSSLEAYCFVNFILAYGLQILISQEEAALLASSISQYKDTSDLFKALGVLFESLGVEVHMIPDIVVDLINKRQYLPAVWFICYYKLGKNFSPSHLLTKEITNLRRSVSEKRPTESSEDEEVEDKDAGRLRAILELVADYELEVDLPGDLIAKLMVPSKKPLPPPPPPLQVRCDMKDCISSTNPQAYPPSPNLAPAQH